MSDAFGYIIRLLHERKGKKKAWNSIQASVSFYADRLYYYY